MQAKTIELTELAQLQERLRSAPSRPETSVRYVQAIELMASEIHAMRSKGYSWDDIVAFLAENGLQVSRTTLRAYLGRVGSGSPRESRSRKDGRRAAVGAIVPRPVVVPSSAPSPPSNREIAMQSESTSPPTSTSRSSPTTGAVAEAPATASGAAEKIPSWSFAVRPDTPDL